MPEYKGWTNRETWLISIHFNLMSKQDVNYAKDHMEELKEGLDPIIRDFLDLSLINWDELKEDMEDNE